MTSTRRRTREDTENTEETISSRKHDEPAAHLYVAAESPPGRVYVGPPPELSTMRTSPLQNRPVHPHRSKRAFKVQFIGGGAHSGANLMAHLVWKKHGVQGVIRLSTSNNQPSTPPEACGVVSRLLKPTENF